MTGELRHEFETAVRGADQDVDLFGAAMTIARIGGHAPDPHAIAAELDRFAESVREQLPERASVEALVGAIDHELFTVQGFHPNTTNYNEPENSYLDRVLERRTGIPITLSLVYMEIAQRVGLRCDGIGYPGHFIVRCGPPEEPVYVDPFQQGARLDREELLANLRSGRLGGASPESFLAAVTRRQLLQRMLNNLHMVFRDARDLPRWRTVVELLLVIEPWNASLVGERGMLHYRLGAPADALLDLERYVAASGQRSVNSGALRLLDELRLRFGGREELR